MTTICIAVDRSGSMRGEPYQACRLAFEMLVSEAATVPGLTLAVVSFALEAMHIDCGASNMPSFPDAPIVAMPSRLAPALRLLDSEIERAVPAWGPTATVPVFAITDGRISDHDEVGSVMSQASQRQNRRFIAMYAGPRWRKFPQPSWSLHILIDQLDRMQIASLLRDTLSNTT